jgi:saccharopepsin
MINAQIGATKSWNGQYTVDCAKVPSLPDLSFYFGGKPYVLKGTDYILEVSGTCMSSFTGLDIPGAPLWIIGEPFFTASGVCANTFYSGDVFLRRYFTVYDLGRNAVGFAESA